MDHIIVRVGGRWVLVADVCTSADGAGIGFGILLKRIDKVLWYARLQGLAVFYAREARGINTAVFRLQSDDVEILPRHGLTAAWLRLRWVASAPFRLGAPWLWAQRTAARVMLGRLYKSVESSTHVPGVVRGWSFGGGGCTGRFDRRIASMRPCPAAAGKSASAAT